MDFDLARHPLRGHLRAVARLAVRLARRHGADPGGARAAALLHDWLKPLPRRRLARLLSGSGVRLDRATRGLPAIWHGPAAAALAPTVGVRNAAVRRAVRWHTTGRGRLSRLDGILIVADYCAAGRGFREARVGRRLAARGLPLALRYVVASKLAWLRSRGLRPHPATLACWRGLWGRQAGA
ncbi:MAG: bis(5'-nucleosyl)-tetraphosphatase (symmetrical) YqeK [bacterium]